MSSGAVRTHLRRKHGAPFVVALGQRGPHSSRWCPDLGSSVSAPQSQGRMLTCTSQSHVLKVAVASSRSSAAPYPEQTTEDGAFMEPRGCNRWQPVANRPPPKTLETSENRCRRLRPVA